MFWTDLPVRDVVRRSRRPLVGLVAVVAVASFGASSTPAIVSVADSELPVSPGDRVLQSVRVAMGPDGTLTEVEGTTVTASADGEESDSVSQAYSPDDVVADLPVRVLTSYRTADGSGTDLSDLEGYDGTVHIDLTVENLTVQAEELSYDVAGASRSRQALVGAPLTVVASADLGSVAPNTVVTQRAGEEDVTNGVLSQGADGATQVQWATILAPPQLSSSATLSLVMDAKDFTTPGFDLSVQPGLVTDPSVGALVQQAFNPAASDEMKLQAATIEAVGEVNDVLAEAGDSISDVRRSLTSATATLGEKTVGDLETSVVQIAASMKSLDGTVNGLGDAISGALESTGSSSLAQLESTVSSIDTLLGDTSGRPGTAPVSGGGCNTTVRTGSASQGSVYQSLISVASTLNGYAAASDSCKVALQNSLLTALGPDLDPFDADEIAYVCRPSTPSDPNPVAGSVTCSLNRTGEQLPQEIADTLSAAEVVADASVDSSGVARVIQEMNELNRILDGVPEDPDTPETEEQIGLLEILDGLKNGGVSENDLGAVRTQVDELGATRAGFQAVLSGLDSDASATFDRLDEIEARDATVYRTLCTIAANPAEPSAAAAATTTALLIGPACTETAPSYDLGTSPKVEAARDALTTMVDGVESDLQASLNAFDTELGQVRSALDGVTDTEGNQNQDLRELFLLIGSLNDQRNDVKSEVDKLEGLEDDARAAIKAAFETARTDATTAVQDGTDDAIEKVSARSLAARKEVEDAFARSKIGMRQAAAGITADGRAAINSQKAKLGKTAKTAAGAIESNVKQGLDTISDTVSASTRDTEAAGKLLTADLTKVLLDLGDPDVDGAGLLGTLGANVGDARAADFQLALATRTATSYAGARGADVAGLQLRQAQAEAAFKRQAQLPAFQVDVPEGVERRTVYTFHLAPGQ